MKVYDLAGKEKGDKKLPSQFKEEIRPDIIKRAVLAVQANSRQRYGAHPEAGKRVSAKLSRRRNNYRGGYGHGISRVPRKILTRRGTQMNWQAALAPGTVGGRRAHPPKSCKIWDKKMNKKENRKAIRSAIAATANKELVSARGHNVPDVYPFIMADDFQNISQTKKLKEVLFGLKLDKEIERVSEKRLRAGKGKSRGRKYKKKTGPLFVVSKDCKLLKSCSNIQGVDVIEVKNLNAEVLAPGCDMARMTVFTESAVDKLEKEKLFM